MVKKILFFVVFAVLNMSSYLYAQTIPITSKSSSSVNQLKDFNFAEERNKQLCFMESGLQYTKCYKEVQENLVEVEACRQDYLEKVSNECVHHELSCNEYAKFKKNLCFLEGGSEDLCSALYEFSRNKCEIEEVESGLIEDNNKVIPRAYETQI